MATATQRVVSFVSTVGGGTGTGGGAGTPPSAGGGATVTTEAVYWHHNDHLGTPQALTDVNGTVVWTASYTPFGIATVNEDPDGDGIVVTNNFRFPGQYFDAETGLNYNYRRTYDPALGRYTQHDPIGLNGGMNPFGYVSGNPISWIDVLGLRKYSSPAEAAMMATAEAMGQVQGQYPNDPKDLTNIAIITGIAAPFVGGTCATVLSIASVSAHAANGDGGALALDALGFYGQIIGQSLGLSKKAAGWFGYGTSVVGGIGNQNTQ